MRRIRQYFSLFRLLYRSRRTPMVAKVLPWIAVLYLLVPVDFVPDLLPVFGQLDDLVVIVGMLSAFWRIARRANR